ncbi:hypothetical protein VITFI_CDS3183 [Vitreoscilla filiformis]|uniref:Uncharacterized protein n=1 Tax=Vitreoscilla filiformis TaxID=63 RepID=A0A221KJE9_VITFI|nr:hypothetical protein VITFI_CDS3183 [Vitreoscilla filiformis]
MNRKIIGNQLILLCFIRMWLKMYSDLYSITLLLSTTGQLWGVSSVLTSATVRM